MMMLILLVGCTHVNRATLIASTASLACDWAQTRSQASTGWNGTMENNPMLGTQPSTTKVDAYFASTIVINAAIWYVMPERYKSIIPLGVTAAQARTIAGNVEQTGMCFR